MKKKSATQSAFFNLRVLIGLFIVLAGVFLALAGLGTFSAITASSAQAQQTHKIIDIPGLPPGFDCSRIHALGIDKMENLRAGLIMVACGESQGGEQAQKGEASPGGAVPQSIRKLLAPLAYGTTDVDVVLPDGTFPHTVQSETYTTSNPDNPNQVVINYNDSRTAPSCYSGLSYSSDGGATFHPSQPLCSGHGTNFGDPVVLYNRQTSAFYAMDLATGCGGQGIGVWKSTDGGVTWVASACAHNGGSDDRESGWADNNSASPFFGRMYASWNDFTTSCGAGGCLYSTHSSDGGVTWSTPVRVQTNSLFMRDVQITGDLAGGGAVYIASMDEGGGGFPHNDTNYLFKSTDGGTTWANTYVGTPFPGPGVCASGYFAGMFSTNGCYWRHEGWGEPAAINNFVHLVYAQHGTGTDPGDVYYIRSTDGGVTFGTPFKLNSDSTDRPQWEPNLSVSPGGTLLATWYDARVSPDTGCTYGSPTSPCYQMFSRKSNDNGATWLPDDTLSDVISPLPAQPDGNIQGTYAGDYDYGTAITTKHLTSWTDGRVAISSTAQQDVFTDRELVGFSVTSTIPACNSIINTQLTSFVVNLSDPALVSSVQASDFTVNGIPANSFTLSNGNATITFTFNTSPVTVQGPQTMHIAAGAILRNSDSMPIFDFTCTFCYAVTPLQVTTTVPPVGGTFSPPAPGTYSYDVNFNQPIDPGSVSTSDLTLTGNVGGTVTAVTVTNGNTTAHFTLNIQFGGSMTASIAAGAITAEGCNSNAAFTGNYTVLGCPPQNHYNITQITESIVPGTTDTGNHCDDCTTTVTLPFPYTLYDQTFTAVNVDSNGTEQFVNPSSVFTNTCLPFASHTYVILPYWDDLYNVNSSFGIFTSISGTAPNRIFNIEHRSQYFPGSGGANFEVRLYEGQSRFDVIYGTVTNGNTSATAGVQKDSTTFDQYFCNGSGAPATGAQSYILQTCAPMASDAFSRKVHGAAGTFNIPLPLTGSVGVECRTGPTYQMIIDFPTSVTVQSASVTSGTGNVDSFSGSGTSQITVNLSGVTDQQRITMTLHGVNNGTSTGDVPISMGVLIGDVNGNGTVSSADVALTKSQVGATVGGSNFREDVNANGVLNAVDVAIVKSDVGHALPP